MLSFHMCKLDLLSKIMNKVENQNLGLVFPQFFSSRELLITILFSKLRVYVIKCKLEKTQEDSLDLIFGHI